MSFKSNVLPALAGVTVMLAIMGLLNGQLLMAQWQYRFNKPVAAVSVATPAATSTTPNPSADNTKSPHPELGSRVSIPTINVDAPVVFEPGTAEWQIQTALRSGVVHYSNSVAPGETGNVVLFGHSSGQPWAPGNYKFVFTMLDKVKAGDLVYVDNNGTRYTYKVMRSQVVEPTDIGILSSGTDHELTLITCTPVGTSKYRLVVHAEQISPDPNAPAASSQPAAAKQPAATSSTAIPAELPGSANGSFWQSLRDLF
jgi:sortase A